MTTTKKITKRDNYAVIAALLKVAEEQGFGLPEDMTYAGLNEFVAHEIELLDNKAAAAAKRAADKKVEGDALREKIYEVLTDENMTLAEIVAAMGDNNITPQSITPRLTQLLNLGQVVKDTVTVPGVDGGKSRKLSAYRKA
jgi:hypothetical protein